MVAPQPPELIRSLVRVNPRPTTSQGIAVMNLSNIPTSVQTPLPAHSSSPPPPRDEKRAAEGKEENIPPIKRSRTTIVPSPPGTEEDLKMRSILAHLQENTDLKVWKLRKIQLKKINKIIIDYYSKKY